MAKLGFTLGTLLCVATLAGCGGSSGGSSSALRSAGTPSPTPAPTRSAPATTRSAPAGHAVAITADSSGALMFNTQALHALAGMVTINFTNRAPEAHNFTLASPGGHVIVATPTFTGATKTLTVKLVPGRYIYYCSVPGHRSSGMQGTLLVQ
jgi:plastocyanin